MLTMYKSDKSGIKKNPPKAVVQHKVIYSARMTLSRAHNSAKAADPAKFSLSNKNTGWNKRLGGGRVRDIGVGGMTQSCGV